MGYSKCLTHNSEWSIISAVWDSGGKSHDGRFHERRSRTGPTLALKGLLSFKTARSSGFISKMKCPQLMKLENYSWLLDIYKSKLYKQYRFKTFLFFLAVEDMRILKSEQAHFSVFKWFKKSQYFYSKLFANVQKLKAPNNFQPKIQSEKKNSGLTPILSCLQ